MTIPEATEAPTGAGAIPGNMKGGGGKGKAAPGGGNGKGGIPAGIIGCLGTVDVAPSGTGNGMELPSNTAIRFWLPFSSLTFFCFKQYSRQVCSLKP